MNVKKNMRMGSLVLLVVLAAAPLALAQGGDDPFEINGDIDNDGMVGPTDIQHVINGALGLNDEGPGAVDRPLRQYIVASPRVSLAPRPGAEDPAGECGTIGAATNFQRGNGRLLVRVGRGIAFRFDRNVEGVWHENACGILRSSLTVHIRPIDPETEPSEVPEEEGWILVGRDLAEARRCGPALGTANIVVRKLFEEPGEYLVRSTIRSAAIPEGEIVAEGETPNFCGGTRDIDVVFTRVRVIDRDASGDDVEWQEENNSPTVGGEFGDRLENGEGAPVEEP